MGSHLPAHPVTSYQLQRTTLLMCYATQCSQMYQLSLKLSKIELVFMYLCFIKRKPTYLLAHLSREHLNNLGMVSESMYCVCTCICVCAHVYVCVQRPALQVQCLPLCSPSHQTETKPMVSPWPQSPQLTCWPVSSRLLLSSTKITDESCQVFTWVLEIQSQVLELTV